MSIIISVFKNILRCILGTVCIAVVILAFPSSKSLGSVENIGYVPVTLLYHLIGDEVFGYDEYLFVSPEDFDRQLTILDSLGYEYLFADDWEITDKPSVIITFDDGYCDNYTEMYPILTKHNAKATIFMIGDMMDQSMYVSRDMIREMSASGLVSFQSHTMHHSILTDISENDIREEIDMSKECISEVTGKPVTALAYPTGKYNDNVRVAVSDSVTFAYTTDYPDMMCEFTSVTIPRYYVSRNCSDAEFLEIIR